MEYSLISILFFIIEFIPFLYIDIDIHISMNFYITSVKDNIGFSQCLL